MIRGRGQPDYTLLTLTFILLLYGAIMLCSASWMMGAQTGDPWHYIKGQVFSIIVGAGALYFFSHYPYKNLRGWVTPLLIVTALLLAAVLFARPVAGVRRWLRLGPVGIQPAEFAKLTAILYLSDYIDRKRSKVVSFKQGIVVPGAVLGVLLLLIALEPDLGTPALMFAVCLLVLFVGGTRMTHLAGTFACAIPVLAYELIRYPYRRQRMLNFLEPFRDPQGTGYQLVQSLYAVGSGGWLGKGLGQGKLKLGFLPAPHTDFIFPVLCEELGLLGSVAVLVLFAAFLVRGIRIARAAPDLFGTLLASGITFLICLQAFFNVAMSIGLLPTKGLPLPFFSYGRSSILVTMICVGILLNVSRHCGIKGGVRRQ